MDLKEYLDQDIMATFEPMGELGCSVLKFSIIDEQNEIRVYPEGIKKLKSMLDFIEKNGMIKE